MSYTLTRNYDGYGSGFLSPDGRCFYVNISKNASSYMADTLSRQGWTSCRYGHDNCDYSQVEKLLIVLRDPVDRWCSGVAQYLVTKILNFIGVNSYFDSENAYDVTDEALSAASFIVAYSPLMERFIFDNLDLLDDHVWQQHEFYKHIMPEIPRHYVVISKTFEQQLQDFGISIFDDADRNDSDNNADKSILKWFFQQRLQNKPSLLHRVQHTYQRDQDIIANICNK